MTHAFRAAAMVGIFASLVSIPLLGALWALLAGNSSTPQNLVYFAAPVAIGLIAMFWWLVLWPLLHLKSFRGIVVGAVVGVLTFLSFAAGFEVFVYGPTSLRVGEGFKMVGLFGLGLFGWIPVLAGAVSGWYAERRYYVS